MAQNKHSEFSGKTSLKNSLCGSQIFHLPVTYVNRTLVCAA